VRSFAKLVKKEVLFERLKKTVPKIVQKMKEDGLYGDGHA
jgi:hypothetical protein